MRHRENETLNANEMLAKPALFGSAFSISDPSFYTSLMRKSKPHNLDLCSNRYSQSS